MVTATPVIYEKGQEVISTDVFRVFYTASGDYRNRLIEKDTKGIVTSTRGNTVNVKFDNAGVTYKIDAENRKYIKLADPNAPKPRQIGEKPPGDHLDVDDPRLAWIWEDASRLATLKRHCAEYDAIADSLGIPGREREFTVTRNVGGLEAKFKVKARSKKLAEAVVEAKLTAGSVASKAEVPA